MLRSLVGSEMCIRDSLHSWRAAASADGNLADGNDISWVRIASVVDVKAAALVEPHFILTAMAP